MRAILLIALLVPALASAHERTHPKILDVHVDPSGVSLLVHFNVMAGAKARDTRGDFDANGDGKLSETEARSLLRRLTIFATHALRLSTEGRLLPGNPPELITQHGVNAPVKSGADLGITLKIRHDVAFSEGTTRLELRDRHPDPKWSVAVRLHARDVTITPKDTAVVDRDQPLALLVERAP